MPHLWLLFVNEIAVRSAKHLLKIGITISNIRCSGSATCGEAFTTCSVMIIISPPPPLLRQLLGRLSEVYTYIHAQDLGRAIMQQQHKELVLEASSSCCCNFH
ncbi:uncharacterized protein LOC141631221 [Silene latifolia]|uniref:uncharacterized protein LOC141631221 n=1 Tax=Silene latifolia TaxID=37657 RepID=UPI003D780CB1